VNARTARSWNSVLSYVALAIASVVVLFPVFWMLTTALRPASEVFNSPPNWFPTRIDFSGFVTAWSGTDLPQYLTNSLIVVSASTLIAVAFSAFAAYGLSRFEFRGKATFATFLLVTQMFPAVMLLVPYFQIISSVGLYNTYGALIITYVAFSIPFSTWMMWGYLGSIPKELDESAAIDGCTPFTAFIRIVLPLCRPGIIATAIYSFITGWNEYIYALAMIQSDNMKTLPIGITALASNDRLDYNALMATSIIAVIPMLIIFIFFQRHLVSGLSAGAVKG
jgi:multiple sugar transport system permease protein